MHHCSRRDTSVGTSGVSTIALVRRSSDDTEGMSSLVKPRRANRTLKAVSRFGERLYSIRRRIATVAVLVLAGLLGYHVVFGRNGLTAFRDKRHDLHDLREQATSLQRENTQLQGHVDRLTSDPNAVEHQAREDLHYTRPGEVIVTLPDSSKQERK